MLQNQYHHLITYLGLLFVPLIYKKCKLLTVMNMHSSETVRKNILTYTWILQGRKYFDAKLDKMIETKMQRQLMSKLVTSTVFLAMLPILAILFYHELQLRICIIWLFPKTAKMFYSKLSKNKRGNFFTTRGEI